MSASSLITLGPAAFRALLTAVRSAVKPRCHSSQTFPPPCRKVQRCDEGSCRIRLNEAQREIDRLRRQVDRIDLCGPIATPVSTRCDERESFASSRSAELASPVQRRRSYAVPPIGDISAIKHLSPLIVQSQHVTSAPTASHLGTQLDVLM